MTASTPLRPPAGVRSTVSARESPSAPAARAGGQTRRLQAGRLLLAIALVACAGAPALPDAGADAGDVRAADAGPLEPTDTGPPDAGPPWREPDASPTPGRTLESRIVVESEAAPGRERAAAEARLWHWEPGREDKTIERLDQDCVLEIALGEPRAARYADVGPIAFSTTTRSMSLPFERGVGYRTVEREGAAWGPRERLRVHAEGGEYAGFEADLRGPAHTFVRRPAPDAGSSVHEARLRDGIKVEWAPLDGERLVVRLESVSTAVSLECRFDPAAAAAVLSRSVLTRFVQRAGETAQLTAFVADTAAVVVPDWGSVEIEARAPALHPAGLREGRRFDLRVVIR